MAVSVVPALLVALTSTATSSLPAGWSATTGYRISQDPGPLMMIGGDNPDDPGETQVATTQQSWESIGYADRDEIGEVICSARSWNGDSDAVAAINDVQAAMEALAGALRANPSLGLSNLLWTSFGTQTEWKSEQGDYGAKALCVFRVYFKALI